MATRLKQITKLADGTVHKLPLDFEQALLADEIGTSVWNDITPLARNEWICWIEDAKRDETRDKRIRVGLEKMNAGKRRPCCWSGCQHREEENSS